MLLAEPPFRHVLEEFLAWISYTLQEVEQWQELKYFPVLVAIIRITKKEYTI